VLGMREHIPDPATESFVAHRNLLFTGLLHFPWV